MCLDQKKRWRLICGADESVYGSLKGYLSHGSLDMLLAASRVCNQTIFASAPNILNDLSH